MLTRNNGWLGLLVATVLATAGLAFGVTSAVAATPTTTYSYTGVLTHGDTVPYAIVLAEGDWVVARETCEGEPGNRPLDPKLSVRDPDGRTVASNDDGYQPGCNIYSSSCVQFSAAQSGSYDFVVGDAAGQGGPYRLTVEVNGTDLCYSQAPTITSAAAASTPVGEPFTFTATAAAVPSATLTWSGVEAVPGLSASGATLSGTPNVAGIYSLTVTASNGHGADAVQSFELTVSAPPVFTSATTASAVVDGPFAFDFAVDGVPAPTVTVDADSLPGWLTASGASLAGTPTAAGTYVVAATASSAAGVAGAELTITVELATFADGPTPTITGAMKVGETLTVDAGLIAPAPEVLTYQWQADAVDIDGATGPTYTLTPAEKGARITVEVKAGRAGYYDAAAASAATAPVVTNLAPGLQLTADRSALRLGQEVRLAWQTLDATEVTAAGAWSGTRPTAGAASAVPAGTGTSTYQLSATNENGTTIAQVVVHVELPATRLGVKAPRHVVAGRRIRLGAQGLSAGEPYTVRVGGVVVAAGFASNTGTVARKVTVPAAVASGTRTVTVTGLLADRVGTDVLRVVGTLEVTVADRTVRASDPQTVTVRHLLPGERVTLSYQGRTVLVGRASKQGVLRAPLAVGTSWGTFTVTATAHGSHQRASTRFRVKIRCLDRSWDCA